MSDLHQALQSDMQAFTPTAAPPFETITGRKRARDRRRLAASGAALVAAVAAAFSVPSLISGPDRLPSYAAPELAPSDGAPVPAPSPSVSLPPGQSYTDCGQLRAGDPLGPTYKAIICDSDDIQVSMMDCRDGTYVLMTRPGRDDLEGLVGKTPQWLKAGPVSTDHGRTEFAFQHCLEHG